MKKMIVLVSMVVFSLSFFAGCDSKGKKCGQLYDKLTSCAKDMGGDKADMKDFGSKDDFVKECKKDYKKAEPMIKCLDKKDCKDFFGCFMGALMGEMPSDKPADMPADAPPADMPAADMPADAPAADMPADAPAADLPADAPAADMPADAPAADMPADAPAADMPADAPAADMQ